MPQCLKEQKSRFDQLIDFCVCWVTRSWRRTSTLYFAMDHRIGSYWLSGPRM